MSERRFSSTCVLFGFRRGVWIVRHKDTETTYAAMGDVNVIAEYYLDWWFAVHDVKKGLR